MKRVIILLAILWLTSCKIEVADTFNTQEEIKVYIYQAGRPVTEYQLQKNSSQYNLLVAWAAQNASGWSPAPVTYVPGVLVQGKNFSLNFLSNLAILNFNGQHSKKIAESEYQFLLQVPHNQALKAQPAAVETPQSGAP